MTGVYWYQHRSHFGLSNATLHTSCRRRAANKKHSTLDLLRNLVSVVRAIGEG